MFLFNFFLKLTISLNYGPFAVKIRDFRGPFHYFARPFPNYKGKFRLSPYVILLWLESNSSDKFGIPKRIWFHSSTFKSFLYARLSLENIVAGHDYDNISPFDLNIYRKNPFENKMDFWMNKFIFIKTIFYLLITEILNKLVSNRSNKIFIFQFPCNIILKAISSLYSKELLLSLNECCNSAAKFTKQKYVLSSGTTVNWLLMQTYFSQSVLNA